MEQIMALADSTQWRGGWTATEPADIGFAWAARGDGDFVDRDGNGFVSRDLGVAAASDGAIGVQHLRLGDGDEAATWRALDADFDFLFVLTGSVRIVTDHGTQPLDAGGCAVHPKLLRHRFVDVSDDFEAIHVTAPARVDVLHDPAPGAADAPVPIYTHETSDQYERGNGPRSYFLYRDLGTREPTADRIHFHVVRAMDAGPGTGWHFHTMAQWFLILGGSSVISVEDRAGQPLNYLDAMCVGRGEMMRHNVTDFSADYAVLEMCIPAVYETIAVDQPVGADVD
jgi:hypothetical protein